MGSFITILSFGGDAYAVDCSFVPSVLLVVPVVCVVCVVVVAPELRNLRGKQQEEHSDARSATKSRQNCPGKPHLSSFERYFFEPGLERYGDYTNTFLQPPLSILRIHVSQNKDKHDTVIPHNSQHCSMYIFDCTYSAANGLGQEAKFRVCNCSY